MASPVQSLADEQTTPAPTRADPQLMGRLFESPDGWDGFLSPETVAGVNSALEGSTDPAADRMRFANTAFLADAFGKTPDEIEEAPEVYRDNWAAQVGGALEGLDDGAFYNHVGGWLKKQNAEKVMVQGMQGKLFDAFRKGEQFDPAFSAQQAELQWDEAWNDERSDFYRETSRQLWDMLGEKQTTLAEPIEAVAAYFREARKGGAHLNENLVASRETALASLQGLDEQDQQIALDLAAGGMEKDAEGEGEGFAVKLSDRVTRAFGRIKESAQLGLDVAVGYQGGERIRRLTLEMDKRLSGEVDPNQAQGWFANMWLDAAESLPTLAVAAIPGGLAVNGYAYKGEIYADLKERGLTDEAADRMSSIGAVPYAALDLVQARMVFAGSKGIIGQALTPIRSAAGLTAGAMARRAAIVGGIELTEQYAAEVGQDLIAPSMQALAGVMGEAVPDVKWSDEFDRIGAAAPQTLAALLPFVLVGTGHATFKDRQYGLKFVARERELTALGFDADTRAAVMESTTPEDAVSAIAQAWEARKASPEQAAAVAAMDTESVQAGVETGTVEQQTPFDLGTMEFRETTTGTETTVFARSGGRVVGRATMDVQEGVARPVMVDVPPAMRRRGIATALYNRFLTDRPGVTLGEGTPRTDEGAAFRQAFDARASAPAAVAEMPGAQAIERFPEAYASDRMAGRRPTEIPIIIRETDGTEVPGLFTGYFDTGAAQYPAVARWTPEGWSDGMIMPGRGAQILTPVPGPTSGEREAPAAPAPTVARQPDGTFIVSANGAPVGTARSPEAAAAIVQRERTAATPPAEPPAAPPPVRQEAEGEPVPPNTTALKKTEIAEIREMFGLEKLDAPTRQRFEQVLSQAKEQNLAGGADALAESIIARPRLISAAEHAGMVLRSAELQNQFETLLDQAAVEIDFGNVSKAAEIRRRADNVLESLDTLTAASDRTGTEIGRALSIRRMRINRETYSLAKIVQRAKIAKQGSLTAEQTEQFRQLAKQIEEQEKRIEKLETDIAAAQVEASKAAATTFVKEGRATRRAAVRVSAEQRRTVYKKELAALGYRMNDITNVAGMSVEAATIVSKIAQTYIEEGISTLPDLVAKLKQDIPDLSDNDIYNAVGGRIKSAKKAIENEAKARVRELQKQARLLAKIDDAAKGLFDRRRVPKDSAEVKAMRKTLGELRLQADRSVRDDAQLKRIHETINAVQDQLSGGFRNVPERGRPDRPDVAGARETLAELRREMGLVDSIATIEEQIRTGAAPAAGTAAPESARIEALKAQRDELRAQLRSTENLAAQRDRLAEQITSLTEQLEGGFRNVPAPSTRKDAPVDVMQAQLKIRELQRLMRTQDSIADLEEQLRTGDYKVSAPEARVIQNEALMTALVKRKQLQREVNDAIERMRKKTGVEKFVDLLTAPRSLLATADMSATLRQGLVLSVRRPTAASKAFVAGAKAFFSQTTADTIDVSIRRHPNQIERDSAGLYLSTLDSAPNKREESFLSNLAERIPVMGAIVRASNRNMSTTLNLLRAASFDQFIDAYPEATIEQKKAFADYVNAASGRGNLGRFNSATKELNVMFFAPRYAVSRFQLLYSPFKNINNPMVRNEIAKDFLALGLVGMTVLALAALAGADVGDDPESSDFGKIIVGDTRIDIWGGLQQPIRLIMQPILAGLDRTGIRDAENDIDLIDAGRRYMSYKLSPAVTVPAALLTGENIIGQEQELAETLIRSVTPLMLQETFDVYQKDEDASKAAMAAALTFVGVGVSEQN